MRKPGPAGSLLRRRSSVLLRDSIPGRAVADSQGQHYPGRTVEEPWPQPGLLARVFSKQPVRKTLPYLSTPLGMCNSNDPPDLRELSSPPC